MQKDMYTLDSIRLKKYGYQNHERYGYPKKRFYVHLIDAFVKTEVTIYEGGYCVGKIYYDHLPRKAEYFRAIQVGFLKCSRETFFQYLSKD